MTTHTILASCKYHGRTTNIDIDTAKYRIFVDLQSQLIKHGGQAMWKDIHMGVASGIKLSGATKLQVIASLPHIDVMTTKHGSVITYKQ